MLFESTKLPFPFNVPPPHQTSSNVAISNHSNALSPENIIHQDMQPTFVAVKADPNTQQTSQILPTPLQNKQPNQSCFNLSDSSGRSTPSNDPSPGKLFVGGLSWQTSSEKLHEYFGVFGNVTDVLIMKDPVTQRSRGFGFITFSDPASVENVLKVPMHILDGKKIDPKHATPKNRQKQSHRTKKIFVGGISQDTTTDEVKNYFNQFGKVEESVMLMDQQTKRHRGFGFVTFENEDVVDRVCDIHFHTIKNKKVECKKAQPKEAVTPTNQLLQKRIMLGGLGMRIVPTNSIQAAAAVAAAAASGLAPSAAASQMQLVQAQAAAAAALQVQNTSNSVYGKVFSGYPQTLHSFRYSPYSVSASAAAAHATASAQQHHHSQVTHIPHQTQQNPQSSQIANAAPGMVATGNPYHTQTYSLPNVDMSSFQNIDWSSMYGLGMYV